MRCAQRAAFGIVAAAIVALPGSVRAQAAYEQLQTFSSLLSQIRLNYVDTVGTAQLVQGAIRGMLATLDPHSYFQSASDASRIMAWRAGELAGTGIWLEDVDGAVTVQAVLAGTPAAKAHISPGDRVVALNDTAVAGVTANDVQARMIGDRGSRLTLRLERGSRLEPETISVRLRLDFLHPKAVTIARPLAPGIGYVRLEQFLETAGKEVHDAVDHTIQNVPRGQPKRLILDLRGNPGGLVNASVDVAKDFLPDHSLVFRTQGRRREAVQEFRTEHNGDYRDVQLIVLVDERTASAAEALSASLQDHDRALIAGRRTFGKALMQRAFELPPNGDAVWLTIGYVLSPSGRLIQRRYRGLNPAQYYTQAGSAGAATDTAGEFHTDAGRVVRGGGGVRPDTVLPPPAPLPVWFTAAADSGYDTAVADSVAATLAATPQARDAWMNDVATWQTSLVQPFLTRVRSRLGARAEPDSALSARLGRILASRVAEVRWGADALEDFRVRNDPDIRAAIALFPRLPQLLAAPAASH